MFSYTGLSEKQVMALRQHHVYIFASGRVSIAGCKFDTLALLSLDVSIDKKVNDNNVERVAQAFDIVVRNVI